MIPVKDQKERQLYSNWTFIKRSIASHVLLGLDFISDGFSNGMAELDSSCVSSIAASILLNGTPSPPFKLQRVSGKETLYHPFSLF